MVFIFTELLFVKSGAWTLRTTDATRQTRARSMSFFMRLGIFVVCLYFLLGVVASNTPPTVAKSDLKQECLKQSPRSFSMEQKERLCEHSLSLDAAPARCAVTAIGTTQLSSSKRDQHLMEMILQLCAYANDAGPAQCWLTFSTQMRLATHLDEHMVNVCKDAQDPRPAKCYQQWLKISAFLPNRVVQDMAPAVTKICQVFDGEINALTDCVKQSPPSLDKFQSFRLCRFCRKGHIEAIVHCAEQLVKAHISPSTIAHICARAANDSRTTVAPHICVIAAHERQQLKWMDEESITRLCDESESDEPVTCALHLRPTRFPSSSKRSSSSLAPLDVAHLCHRVRNATTISSCVNHLPLNTFSPQAVIRLCAASSSANFHGSLYPATCISKAKQLLRLSSNNDDNMLIRLCEQANSSAPIDCLAATLYGYPSLTTDNRITLCQLARSTAPQECLAKIRHHVPAHKLTTEHTIALCSQATSLGPAICMLELTRFASNAYIVTFGVKLCQHAQNAEPTKCYRSTPASFSELEKTELCQQSESEAPAQCAVYSVTRLAGRTMDKISLCHGARSIVPALCAAASPYGMTSADITTLCRLADDEMPAKCAAAAAVSSSTSLYSSAIAQVCSQASSTAPAKYLAQKIRQHVTIDQQVITECRSAIAAATSLKIVKVTYNCSKLIPNCALFIHVHLLDQFGDELPNLDAGVIHISAVIDETHSYTAPYHNGPILQGLLHTEISKGVAIFRDLRFLTAGHFILTFRMSNVTDMIARIHIHEDKEARRLQTHCGALFDQLQCGTQQMAKNTTISTESFSSMQLLHLDHRQYLSALTCELHWMEHFGGLMFHGTTSHGRIYGLHRSSYHFLTGVNIPTEAMSSWERLGLIEGANRSEIRRAYHRRSLEWHPDKWSGTSMGLTHHLKTIEHIYLLITNAYHQLYKHDDAIVAAATSTH